MTASPFRTTPETFVETPVPLRKAADQGSRPLEDIPFGATGERAGQSEASETRAQSPLKAAQPGLFTRLFSGRRARQLREQMLEQELKDLRASYAGLLHATDEIRERFEAEAESRQSVQKALSPFPAAILGIETIQTRQDEAGEILLTIRERVTSSAERDEEVMASLGFLTEGVGSIQSGVGKVDERIGTLAEGQAATTESLGTLGTQMETRFEEVKEVTRESGERLEQNSEDVLVALRKIEASSQRGLWIFASLLGAVVIALICFAAAMGQLKEEQGTPAPTTPALQSEAAAEETAAVEAPEANGFETIILSDDNFDF